MRRFRHQSSRPSGIGWSPRSPPASWPPEEPGSEDRFGSRVCTHSDWNELEGGRPSSPLVGRSPLLCGSGLLASSPLVRMVPRCSTGPSQASCNYSEVRGSIRRGRRPSAHSHMPCCVPRDHPGLGGGVPARSHFHQSPSLNGGDDHCRSPLRSRNGLGLSADSRIVRRD